MYLCGLSEFSLINTCIQLSSKISYRKSPEETKNNGEHEKRVNTNTLVPLS